MWARQKRGHDTAVLLFFLAMFLLREMPLMQSLGATRVCKAAPLSLALILLVVMLAVL